MSTIWETASIAGHQRQASLGKFFRRRDGAAAVEFAMVALPFFALIIAIFQIGVVFLAQHELETAVEQSSRLVLTGQAQQQNFSQSNFAAKVCANLPALFTCANVMIDLQTASSFANAKASAPALTFNAQGQVTNAWRYQTGNQGDIVVMRAMYQWPVFLGPLGFNLSNLSNGNRLLVATAVFKNEPY